MLLGVRALPLRARGTSHRGWLWASRGATLSVESHLLFENITKRKRNLSRHKVMLQVTKRGNILNPVVLFQKVFAGGSTASQKGSRVSEHPDSAIWHRGRRSQAIHIGLSLKMGGFHSDSQGHGGKTTTATKNHGRSSQKSSSS